MLNKYYLEYDIQKICFRLVNISRNNLYSLRYYRLSIDASKSREYSDYTISILATSKYRNQMDYSSKINSRYQA